MNLTNKNRTAVGIVLAALTVFFWGITFVCTKYLLRSFTSFEVLIIRFLLAYIGLWFLHPHFCPAKEKSHELYFALAGLCGVTIYQFSENVAISYTSASNVSIIVSICPIFTAIIAQIFLHEKHLSPRFFLGFFLAIAGVALVSFNGTAVLHLSPKGDIIALCSSISWGFYSLFVSKINSLGYKSIPATRKMFFYALLFMIPIAAAGFFAPELSIAKIKFAPLFNWRRFSDFLNWVNLLFLGFIASGFCFVSWSIACHFVGTVRVTAGIYLIPVVTVVFAFFALGEPITLMGILGMILTISGLFISLTGNRH